MALEPLSDSDSAIMSTGAAALLLDVPRRAGYSILSHPIDDPLL